ncbi:MAG: D-alanyl-D-alanine carboxypeptidase [Lachnospira sp.]|nr:D-alanyl-D-alanine carboxypeptidase [Lachnospira sp.]
MIYNNLTYKMRVFLARLVVVALSVASIGYLFPDNQVYAEPSTTETSDSKSVWPVAPDITSGSAILIDADTGAILYEKNAHETGYPASTTKILTGLLVIENCNLEDIVTFSREAAESVAYDEANLGTRKGEQYTVEQALYGLLLHSANEIAYGLAEHVSGSVDAFVEIMNARAKEMGALDTNFVNASGLHNDNHYTTPYDMAMIARGCYNNTTFVNIDSTSSTYIIPPTNKMSYKRYVRHRHEMLKGREYYYEYCRGGKTGYTSNADYTLVTFAEKNGMRLICVCFQSGEDTRFTDTRALFDWGFENFEKVTASSSDISSIFSTNNLYNSKVFNNYNYRFNISTSTLTLPDNISVGDITMDVAKDSVSTTTDGVYTANINYKYKDYTVGIAKLTIASSDNFAASSNLPYKITDDENIPKAKNRFSINIWWLVLAGVMLLILMYAIMELKHRRKHRHVRRTVKKHRRVNISRK